MLKIFSTLSLIVAVSAAQAQERPARFWNLTSSTLSTFQVAPKGTQNFSENFTLSEPDKTVEHDERLRLPGVKTGVYDVKIVTKRGKACLVRDVAIKAGEVFSLEDKDIKACR